MSKKNEDKMHNNDATILQEDIAESHAESSTDSHEDSDQLTVLETRIQKLEEEIEEKSKEYIVKLAELENSRKRLEKDFDRMKELSNERVIVNFLEILDNLERALNYEGDIRKGVDMIYSQFKDAFYKEGVSHVDTKEFNPEYHQVVTVEKSDIDGIEEIRKGYVFKGKVIRPALVKVLKKEA